MDIFDRSKGTIDALFSPDLWTMDGLLTEAGGKTFWDRSTLMALDAPECCFDLKDRSMGLAPVFRLQPYP